MSIEAHQGSWSTPHLGAADTGELAHVPAGPIVAELDVRDDEGPLDVLSKHLERQAAEQAGTLGVLPELVADDPSQWSRIAELTQKPHEGLLALVNETADRWNAPRHVAAALLWKAYAYWHTLPMALGWALNRRVPLMGFGDTLVRPSAGGVTIAAAEVTVAVLPDDPLAGAPGTVVVPDLAAAVRDALIDGQRPVISALGELARVGERTLWGSTAEALAHSLLPLCPYDEVAGLLEEIGPPVAGLLVPDGDGYRRRTCCLWVALPNTDPCPTCCIRR